MGDFFSAQMDGVMMQLMARLMDQVLKASQDLSSAKKNSSTQASGASSSQSTAASGAQSAEQSGSAVSGSFADLINRVSAKYGVNAELVQAVVKAESNFNPNAVSGAGAQGLMQLMPGTAQWLGVENPLDPEQNVEGGVKFLSSLLDRYDGNVKLALAAYNAGPGAVDRYGGIPPYAETQTYVNRILGYLGSSNEWSG